MGWGQPFKCSAQEPRRDPGYGEDGRVARRVDLTFWPCVSDLVRVSVVPQPSWTTKSVVCLEAYFIFSQSCRTLFLSRLVISMANLRYCRAVCVFWQLALSSSCEVQGTRVAAWLKLQSPLKERRLTK